MALLNRQAARLLRADVMQQHPGGRAWALDRRATTTSCNFMSRAHPAGVNVPDIQDLPAAGGRRAMALLNRQAARHREADILQRPGGRAWALNRRAKSATLKAMSTARPASLLSSNNGLRP